MKSDNPFVNKNPPPKKLEDLPHLKFDNEFMYIECENLKQVVSMSFFLDEILDEIYDIKGFEFNLFTHNDTENSMSKSLSSNITIPNIYIKFIKYKILEKYKTVKIYI